MNQLLALAVFTIFLPSAFAQQGVSLEEFDELAAELDALKEKVGKLDSGTTQTLVSGYAFAGYRDYEGADSSFYAGFNPIFMWSLSEDVFFEGELELELEDGETELGLEYAHLAYFFNDYLTLGVGKFLTPFNIFGERLHPAWINKLPTAPLFAGHDGFLPMTQVGVDVRGGAAVGDFKVNYAVYAANGLVLGTEDHEAGALLGSNFDDNNNNKSFGGRLGLLPVHYVELGVSYLTGRVSDTGDQVVDAQLWGADISLSKQFDEIYGNLDVRVEYIQQNVDDRVYVDGTDTFDFSNKRSGWYAQVAYRPSKLETDWLKNMEFVVRYSSVDLPEGTPAQEEGEGFDQSDVTLGVNYWINPSAVFKAAYAFDSVDAPGEDAGKFTIQFAIGF